MDTMVAPFGIPCKQFRGAEPHARWQFARLVAAGWGTMPLPFHVTRNPRSTCQLHLGICNLLRGPYKRNEYRKVILPLTVLRRFDCLLAPTKAKVLAEHAKIKTKPETVVRSLLQKITGRPFYNLSKLDLGKLLDDPNQLAPNLNAYINGFSPNVRDIMDRFAFDQQVARMAEKNLLFEVVKAFAAVDLGTERVDNTQMGYVFEELIRIGAEQANEEAGEHFTPTRGDQADGQPAARSGKGSGPKPRGQDHL
jgi:hypothetical protein